MSMRMKAAAGLLSAITILSQAHPAAAELRDFDRSAPDASWRATLTRRVIEELSQIVKAKARQGLALDDVHCVQPGYDGEGSRAIVHMKPDGLYCYKGWGGNSLVRILAAEDFTGTSFGYIVLPSKTSGTLIYLPMARPGDSLREIEERAGLVWPHMVAEAFEKAKDDLLRDQERDAIRKWLEGLDRAKSLGDAGAVQSLGDKLVELDVMRGSLAPNSPGRRALDAARNDLDKKQLGLSRRGLESR